jgi:hypothetical protein
MALTPSRPPAPYRKAAPAGPPAPTEADRAVIAHLASLPPGDTPAVGGLELVTLAGRVAAFPAGYWPRLLAWDREWAAACRRAWAAKLAASTKKQFRPKRED